MSNRIKSGALAISLVAVGMPSAHAANLFTNGGFENPVLASGAVNGYTGGMSIGAWSVVGAQVLLIQKNYGEPGNGVVAFNSQEGSNAVDLTGAANQGTTSGVTQSVATTIGSTYNLSFYVGRLDDNGNAGHYYTTPSTVNYSLNGGALVGATNSNVTVGAINWRLFTTSFVATQANTLFSFYNGTPASGPLTNNYVGLDNLSLDLVSNATVPEPGSLSLLAGIAVTGVGFAMRRSKKIKK